ncbi:MAG: pyruvate kinase [Acidobacteriota bacterium]|nr:pyruvate kinase [Acidobacteriota bacterium]
MSGQKIETDVFLLRKRRTKIVATVGPACESEEMIRRLIEAGVNLFRLNMSHGSHEEHGRRLKTIRKIAAELEAPTAVLADLCGPKIRTGRFENGAVTLTRGERVTVTTREVIGSPRLIPSRYASLHGDVEPGDPILLDDGKLELHVESVSDQDITTTVVHGGLLKDNKGMNLPKTNLSVPALTEKDKLDAEFAIEQGVDFLALSFVRTAEDVLALRRMMTDPDEPPQIIAKIEKPEALVHIEEILDASDGIMVARGDLGVEMAPQMVPPAQDQLVLAARRHHKPVIVATQMLESMIEQPRPTRAEVTDVSHAVVSGVDAVMLSAETAVGDYAVEAVEMMDTIARQMEALHWKQSGMGDFETAPEQAPIEVEKAVAHATAQLSRELLVRSVVVISRTGTSARQVSSARPSAPILAVTRSVRVWRRTALLWGVVPILAETEELQNPAALARMLVYREDLAKTSQFILMVMGFSMDARRNEPSVTVITM